ncbi:hypothetical protein FACS189460_5980 [Deltaproteobacteria bacterium]|nr:hypothetical protein FACS189460_5980 [Deltaproteobacteria bacterium]
MESVMAEVLPPQPAGFDPPTEIILVFSSTTEVLNVEDLLEAGGLAFELVPVPKEVNPNCGLAISFRPESALAIDRALARAGLAATAAYLRRGGEFTALKPAKPAPPHSPAQPHSPAPPPSPAPPAAGLHTCI